MSEVCDGCRRTRWEYYGPARDPQNCMREFEWAEPANLRECYRLTVARLESELREARAERDRAWGAAVRATGLMLNPDSDNLAWGNRSVRFWRANERGDKGFRACGASV